MATCAPADKLGNPAISTQHLIGACKWEQLSETRWSVTYQIRVAHWKSPASEGDELQTVTGYGVNTMEFELSEETWKIAFLKVRGRQMEGNIVALLAGKE